MLEPFSRTYITLIVPGADRHRIAGLHDPVLTALRERDPEKAADALRRHFDAAGAMLARLWPTDGPTGDGQALEPSPAALAARP